ncbi:MAG: hypothetical protein U0821_27650 [Chloroflexota bacterium]
MSGARSTVWDWPGSRWWRVDLHAHSPASHDFKHDPAVAKPDWQGWVDAARAAGLHAIAVTDHHSPDGVDEIRTRAGAVGLTVFPGVEVSAGGIHLLCLLDSSATRDEVVALLSSLGIQPPAFGQGATTSSRSIVDTIDAATQGGALVIAAHVNAKDGLLKTLDGQERLKALAAPGLMAAEITPLAPHSSTEMVDPCSAAVQEWLNGAKADGRRLSQIWCSDSHDTASLGQRFTWVKMTKPDLAGLRLALGDGADSLRPASRSSAGDPNVHAMLAIEGISVTQARYLGRSNERDAARPFILPLNPWLNAIIGGRGTGKSTLVDLLRLALRREAELRTESDSTLRDAFDRRMRVPRGRLDEGLLTENTLVEVTYRKDGEQFILAWDGGGETPAISRVEGGDRIPEEGSLRDRFPVRIYSQKQLFDLAGEPHALLGVIDDDPAVGGAELARRREQFRDSYLALRAEVRQLHARVAELPARRADLADVRRRIALVEQSGHADRLSDYRVRSTQNDAWESIQTSAVSRIDDLASLAERELQVADIDGSTVDDVSDPAGAALLRAHASIRTAVETLRAAVTEAIGRARREIAAAQSGEDAASWLTALQASEARYAEVTGQLAAAGVANPDEYRDLLQRATSLQREVESIEPLQASAEAREREAHEALLRYRDLRASLSDRRTQRVDEAASSLIKVQINRYGRRDDLESFVRASLDIPAFDADYAVLVERISPGATQEWSFDSLDGLVADLREKLRDPASQIETRDRRFESNLRSLPPERIDRLALYCPEDDVSVSFRDERGGQPAWKRLELGSPGQQTAALLAFVLGQGSEPIVLDQPEDDLDNTVIYDVLVRRLREIKASRQVIVVTHNPNVVVHGDAELVVSLQVKHGETQIAASGGLQEPSIREEICRVMEGGRDAFSSRYHRIMLTDAAGGR